jgi:hypothetical protein
VGVGHEGGSVDAASPSVALSDLDTLVLDPETLVFRGTSANSRRYSVTGVVQEAELCVTLIWFDVPATCGEFAEESPYVLYEPAADGRCLGREQLGYYLTVLGGQGCYDFEREYSDKSRGMDLINVELEVASERFSGRIIADNRSTFEPTPVTFGLRMHSDAPQYAFVAWNDGLRESAWISGFAGGDEVRLFDTHAIANCDGSAYPSVGVLEAVLDDETEGEVYATWDGNLWVETEQGCEEPTPAPPGDYEARLCYGQFYDIQDSGDFLVADECVAVGFALPDDEVVIAEVVLGE